MTPRTYKLPFFVGLVCACIGAFSLAGCYVPGDLGDKPFRCTVDHPECPDGYICDLDNTHKDTYQWCVRDTTMSALTTPASSGVAKESVANVAAVPQAGAAAVIAPALAAQPAAGSLYTATPVAAETR